MRVNPAGHHGETAQVVRWLGRSTGDRHDSGALNHNLLILEYGAATVEDRAGLKDDAGRGGLRRCGQGHEEEQGPEAHSKIVASRIANGICTVRSREGAFPQTQTRPKA